MNNEEILVNEELKIERKTFEVQLRQNPRGKFVRVKENTSGRISLIAIPVGEGLGDLARLLLKMNDGQGR